MKVTVHLLLIGLLAAGTFLLGCKIAPKLGLSLIGIVLVIYVLWFLLKSVLNKK